MLEEGGCSELVVYHVLYIKQVVTNSTSSIILYIPTNHCLMADGAHLYIYIYIYIYACTCYTGTLIIALAVNIYYKHTQGVVIIQGTITITR